MDGPEIGAQPAGIISAKIGPIFDPAFLKILHEDQIKNVVLTVAKAEHSAAVAHAKALEEVVRIVEGVRVQTGGR